MSTSAHEFFDWLFSQFGHRKQHTDSGWQRVPPAQDTDGIRLPNVIEGIVGGTAWNGPTGTRRAAYLQEHRHNTPIPPTAQDTPGEVPAHKPEPLSVRRIAEMADLSRLPTVPSLRQSQEWLHEQVPGQHLPVQRQVSATRNLTPAELPSWMSGSLPVQRLQPASPAPNEEALDAMLQTMRANSRPLPAFLGFTTDTSVVPDLPTEPQTQEQADAWLNSAVFPLTELHPMDEQSLASADKTASNLLGVTEQDCTPDLTDEDDPEATKASALLKLRFCEHKKESE